MNKMNIEINGNIGAGKTTFLHIMGKTFENSTIVDEPVKEWKETVDESKENILHKFYKDPKRWAYSFQNIAYITRAKKTEDSIRNSSSRYNFFDRSIKTDKYVFEKMLHEAGHISDIEHKMYNMWYDFYHQYVRKETYNIIIYLRCDPMVAYERIQKRNRIEEKDITLEYLTEVHRYHEEWLNNENNNNDHIITIDCNKDFEHDIVYQQEIIDIVKSYLANKLYYQLKENLYCNDNFNGMFTNSFC